ncbi:unnamed protein product [Urochloa humidicola]
MEHEMESYNKPLPGKSDVVNLDPEGMKDDEAMRARFEDWMKEYGRAYRDEEEKERRFRIFKATARSCSSRSPKIEKAPLAIIHKLWLPLT